MPSQFALPSARRTSRTSAPSRNTRSATSSPRISGNSFAPSCALFQRHHGIGAESRRVAEAALAGAQREPGKEAELDVADQCELTAGRVADGRFDVRLEAVGIDQPDDHQHAEHDEGDQRTETQGNPFEKRTRPTL